MPIRDVSFRVEVLRKNIPIGQLVYSSPPSLFMDGDADIKLSMSGNFQKNSAVDYLTDELRPVMTIDGKDYNLGVLRVATRTETGQNSGVLTDTIEAYDRSLLLSYAKIENRDFWAAGTSYDSIVAHYLSKAGISRSIMIASNNVLQSDREDWDIGTSYLEIINTLLDEINYNPIYFDLDGVARITPYKAPAVSDIAHRFGTGDNLSLMTNDYSKLIDVFEQPNVFIAILENPEYSEPLVARAENDSPGSRLSTISRGIRIPKIYRVDNIASAEELQKYVNRLRDESTQLDEIVTVRTAAMPSHNAGDVLAINHPEITGVFRETAWSMTLEAGSYMEHTLRRVVLM